MATTDLEKKLAQDRMAAEIAAFVDKTEQDMNTGLEVVFKRITAFYPLDPELYINASIHLFTFIKNIIMQIGVDKKLLKDLSDVEDLKLLKHIMDVAATNPGCLFGEKKPPKIPLKHLRAITRQFTVEENEEFLQALKKMDYYQDFWMPEFMAEEGAPQQTILHIFLKEVQAKFVEELTNTVAHFTDPDEEYTSVAEETYNKSDVLQAMRELLAYAPRSVSLQSKTEVCDYFEKYMILPLGSAFAVSLSSYQILMNNFNAKINNAQSKIEQAKTSGQPAVASKLSSLQQAKEECLDEKQRFLKNVRIYLQFRNKLEKEVTDKKEKVEALQTILETFIIKELIPTLTIDPRVNVGIGLQKRITAFQEQMGSPSNTKSRVKPPVVLVESSFKFENLRQTIAHNPAMVTKLVATWQTKISSPQPSDLPKAPAGRRPSSAAFAQRLSMFNTLSNPAPEPLRRASVSTTAAKPPTFPLPNPLLARRNTAGAIIENPKQASTIFALISQKFNNGVNAGTGNGFLAPPTTTPSPRRAAANTPSTAIRRFSTNIPESPKQLGPSPRSAATPSPRSQAVAPSPKSQAGKAPVPAFAASQAGGSTSAASSPSTNILTQFINTTMQRISPKKSGTGNASTLKGKSPVKPATSAKVDNSTPKTGATAAAKDKSPVKPEEGKSALPPSAASTSNGNSSTQRKKSKNNR